MFNVAGHSLAFSMVLRRRNICSTVLYLFFRRPAWSLKRAPSTAFWILWMMILPITFPSAGGSVKSCQFQHFFRSPSGFFPFSKISRPASRIVMSTERKHLKLYILLVPYPFKQSCQFFYYCVTLCFEQICWDLIISRCFSALCLFSSCLNSASHPLSPRPLLSDLFVLDCCNLSVFDWED